MAATRAHRTVRQKAKGPIDPRFGARLRALRTARGLSQADLAGSDFTSGFISLVETGRTRISLRAADIFARRLDVTVPDLMNGVETKDQRLELRLLRAEQELSGGAIEGPLAFAGANLPRSAGALRGRLLRLRGRALTRGDRAHEAIAPLDEAARIFRGAGARDLFVRTLFDQAQAYARLDAPGEAANLALEAERRVNAGELVDRTFELQVQRLLANMFVRTGDFVSADLRAERALQIAQDTADPDALARVYAGLAITREEQGDYEAALTAARRSLELFSQLEREREVAEAWNSLGWLYVQRGHLTKAEEMLAKAERAAAAVKHGSLEALIAATRAELELARKRPERALEYVQRALAHPQISRYGRAQSLWIQAKAITTTKATVPEIRKAFAAALAAFESEPRHGRARVHESYAAALTARGRADEANAEYRRALELHRPLVN